jgi:hypothetical protein
LKRAGSTIGFDNYLRRDTMKAKQAPARRTRGGHARGGKHLARRLPVVFAVVAVGSFAAISAGAQTAAAGFGTSPGSAHDGVRLSNHNETLVLDAA